MLAAPKNQIDRDYLQPTEQMLSHQAFDESSQVDIVFKHLTYSIFVKDDTYTDEGLCSPSHLIEKRLLNNVSGICKGGQFTAIMGASGAGKTTLLNALACRLSPYSLQGQVYANSQVLTHEQFGTFANYVMQQDILIDTMTVGETLQFAAELKLNTSRDEKQKKIADMIAAMKLERCVNTPIGNSHTIKGISGGEKRRTTIAFQLISDPKLLVLDEPTSGLDSLTSFTLCKYLQYLALTKGKTIITTIHQPSTNIFQLFDRLILLAEGQIIYQGAVEDVKNYFQANFCLFCPQFSNPADYLMSILHPQDQMNLCRYPAYHDVYRRRLLPMVSSEIAIHRRNPIQKREVVLSCTEVLKILLWREMLKVGRNPTILRGRLIQSLVLAIFVGGVFARFSGEYTSSVNWRSLSGFCFGVATGLVYTSILPVALVFPMERQVFIKEESSKLYTPLNYFLARNIIQIPYQMVFPLIISLILYWFVNLSNTAEQFFTLYLISFILSMTGSSLGMLIGSFVDRQNVSSMIQIIIELCIVFGAYIKNYDNIPKWIQWVTFLSPIRYGFAAVIKNEVKFASTSNIGDLNLPYSIWINILLLFCLGILFRLLTLLVLYLLRTKLQ